MKKIAIALSVACALPGCADIYLDSEIKRVEGANISLSSYKDSGELRVETAMKLAFEMADGYARAARYTSVTQDIASGGLILSAGSAALGIADSVANDVLADRIVRAVTVEQFMRRGVPQDAIVALYDGASRHNCVALSGRFYTKVDLTTLKPTDAQRATAVTDEFAAFLMVLVMREIEYRTYAGLSRDLESFGSLVEAFTGALENVESPAEDEASTQVDGSGNQKQTEGTARVQGEATKTTATGKKQSQVLVQNPGLVRFFKLLSGCLSKPTEGASVKPDTSKT